MRLGQLFWGMAFGAALLAAPAMAEVKTVRPAPSILFDAASGEVISLNRAGEAWYPASLTKLMTAYVVFQKLKAGTLTIDQRLPVSELAAAQAPSKVGLPPGQTIPVDLALQAMLVYSANDMAYVLAEGASGSIANFARDMNQAARDLGMAATHYVNPNGLFDPRQVTSARDLGVLAAVMLKQFPEQAHYFNQDFVRIGGRSLRNHNSLLNAMPDADGMKTGFVCDSGYNLVASASRNGRKLIAVVLGQNSGFARTKAAQSLLETGFATPPNPAQFTIGSVSDMRIGEMAPVDMTPSVCRRKFPVMMVDAAQAAGWSVAFGSYERPEQADTAMRLRMVSAAGFDAPGFGGVLKLPDGKGYSAIMWGLTARDSIALCQRFLASGASCERLPPAFAQSIAAANAIANAKFRDNQPAIQGSDDDPKKVTRAKKRVRKKLR